MKQFELIINEENDTGVDYIALVDEPAIESDWILPGPMTALDRIYPAVATASSMMAVRAYTEGAPLPTEGHPLNLLFPEAIEQLQGKGGEE